MLIHSCAHTQVIDPHTILSADEIKDLKEVFELFDEDRSGNIDMEELGCALSHARSLRPSSPRCFLSLCDVCNKNDNSAAR